MIIIKINKKGIKLTKKEWFWLVDISYQQEVVYEKPQKKFKKLLSLKFIKYTFFGPKENRSHIYSINGSGKFFVKSFQDLLVAIGQGEFYSAESFYQVD